MIHHGYKVVTNSAYWEGFLSRARPGTAKNKVYRTQYERVPFSADDEQILQMVADEEKTLYYANPSSLIGHDRLTPSQKALRNQLFALKMDDAIYGLSAHALKKDSEFLQLFNHYILKAVESGCFNRLHRKYFIDLNTKENFEMNEAQPLGIENVMFCFICLSIGILVSFFKVMLELMMKKLSKHKRWAITTTTTRGEKEEGPREREASWKEESDMALPRNMNQITYLE